MLSSWFSTLSFFLRYSNQHFVDKLQKLEVFQRSRERESCRVCIVIIIFCEHVHTSIIYIADRSDPWKHVQFP
jgi:hypothetical protein